MATIFAQLASNRTKEEYVSIVNSLKKKPYKFKLSIGVYVGQDLGIKLDKHEPFYDLELFKGGKEASFHIYAKDYRELMEKSDVFYSAQGI